MWPSKSIMVAEIKKRRDKKGRPYTSCRVLGGSELLEKAPEANVRAMYQRVCLSATKKETQIVKPAEKQLEFNF